MKAETDRGEWLARLERACGCLATKAGIDRLQAGTIESIVGVVLAGAVPAAAIASTAVTSVLSSKEEPDLCEPCPAAASSSNPDK